MFLQRKPYPRKFSIMQTPGTVPTAAQQEQIDRGFGMFIHFGINTFNNTEWSNGKLPVSSYCPTGIDADEWVKTAYEAGMNRKKGCKRMISFDNVKVVFSDGREIKATCKCKTFGNRISH